MSLLRLDEVSLEFGDVPILRNASFALEREERVCLLGRNGAGKTTLFRLLTGAQQADSGEVQLSDGLSIAELSQALPADQDREVREFVMDGMQNVRAMRERFEALSARQLDRHGLAELEALQLKLDAADGWHLERRVESFVTEMNLPAGKRLSELSGGWQRRVALARALVGRPDVLLLDEPTNHLDLATIRWLEDLVRGNTGSVVFITHDRAFLQRLATRIVELDRGALVSWPGDYENYLRRKEKALEDEARETERFDKKLAEEEQWVRQGIKARRTRNEGRVRALEAMRQEHASRLKRAGTARIRIDRAGDSGRKVIRLHHVSHGFGEHDLIRNLSLKIMRGDRIGLVGNNGVGKSTLLRIMLGHIEPREGTVKHGTDLAIGHFDPLVHDLDPDKSVAFNVGDGRDYVKINDKEQHVIGYLKGFLFSARRAMTPVRALSGGERNRVALAKLFTQPSNLLVLDEPTNDLDIETLEVLEAQLVAYTGTLIVVSHDRHFLDNVVTSILVFERDDTIREYVGGYSDWARRGRQLAEHDRPDTSATDKSATMSRPRRSAPTKLSYKDQRELDALPARIEELEEQVATLASRIAAEDFYEQGFEATGPVLAELDERKAELDAASERWLELEEQREAFAKRSS